MTLKQRVENLERELIEEAIDRYGNIRDVAKALGLSGQGLRNKLERYGFELAPLPAVLSCPKCGMKLKKSRNGHGLERYSSEI